MSNILKGLNESSLADQMMQAARAAGLKPRVAGTPEQERERTHQMMIQRQKDREEQEKQIGQEDFKIIDQLKSDYEQMLKKYKSLGGSDWQYADREQNLTDGERLARSMEPKLHQLRARIIRAEKHGMEEGVGKDLAKLGGMSALAIGAGLAGNYADQQHPKVEVGGQQAFLIKNPGWGRVPDTAMILKGKDGKTYKVWSPSRNNRTIYATPVEDVKEGVEDLELYGLRVGDTVKAEINGQEVQGDIIDIFPESMEVELALRGPNAGKTVTVDVRDTEHLSEAQKEADYGANYQDMVKRVGQLAKEGPRKTVYDPVRRVYKTVPVNPPKKEEGVAEGSMPYPHGKPEAGDKITWYHSSNYPEIEGAVIGWKDGHLVVQSIDPSPRNTEKTVAKYRVPKNNILSVEKQGVAEGVPGKQPKRQDRFHINKDGKPATLASYADKESAIRDRDAKYPDAKVQQVGPKGKVKGEFEEAKADPTSSWVVYDGDKVKRFKTHEGAQSYAKQHGGKVSSSAYYADKIQKQGLEEGIMDRLFNKDKPAEGLNLVYYIKNPDGTKVYANIKDAQHLAQLQQKYRSGEKKALDYRRPDVVQWLEKRGVNLRKFWPGAEITVGDQGVAEGSKKIPASNNPVDPKDLVVSLKDVPVKKPRGHKQYDPAKEFPGVKAFQKQGVAEASTGGVLWRVEEPRGQGGHAQRYYVVKGYDKNMKIWKNKIGAGDFINKADAEAKAAELNQGVTEEQLDELNWKKGLATGAMALGALGALGSAQARVMPDGDGGMTPSVAQSMQSSEPAAQSNRAMPNQGLQTVEKVSREADGIIITHDGKDYKVQTVPSNFNMVPRGAIKAKVSQGQLGFRGIGNYTVYLIPNGTALLLSGNPSINEQNGHGSSSAALEYLHKKNPEIFTSYGDEFLANLASKIAKANPNSSPVQIAQHILKRAKRDVEESQIYSGGNNPAGMKWYKPRNVPNQNELSRKESAIMKGLQLEGNDEEHHTGGSLGTTYPSTYEQETLPYRTKGQKRTQAIAFEGKK